MKRILILLLVPVFACAMDEVPGCEDEIDLVMKALEKSTFQEEQEDTDMLIKYAIREKIFRAESDEQKLLQAMQERDPEWYNDKLDKLCAIRGSNKTPNKRFTRTTIKSDFKGEIRREIENAKKVENLEAQILNLENKLRKANLKIDSLSQMVPELSQDN